MANLNLKLSIDFFPFGLNIKVIPFIVVKNVLSSTISVSNVMIRTIFKTSNIRHMMKNKKKLKRNSNTGRKYVV